MNDTIQGFERILEEITRNNENNLIYTHKEVRALARCFMPMFETPAFSEITRYSKEIKALLDCLAVRGLNHYDRAFLAGRIIKLLEKEREYIRSESF